MSPEHLKRARELGLFALALVLVAAAGYSAGRFSAPAEVEERVEYRTEWRTKTVEVVRWKTARAVDTRTTSTPVLLPSPDGGVVIGTKTVTEQRERVDSAGGTDTSSSTDGKATGETEKKTTSRPDWRVGVLVGAQLGGGKPALEIQGPLVFGAHVERRILGGVSAGVWGTTGGSLGGSLSAEF